ncbi:MAG: NfeD family protein [Desulfobacterales bacterium]|nr:MAG: NfeD family protein [Desulfobacterales bacterium]
MRSIFMQFNGVEVFFLLCAVVGGIFVLTRLILQFIGIDHHGDGDFGVDGPHLDAHHADSDVGFKILSIHGLTSFLLMFGLVGLALYRQSKMGTLLSMTGAVAAGLASVWMIGKLFSLVAKLQSSGTITIDSTVGAEGRVYLTIPEDGTGRVLINVRNSLREYDAASVDHKTIKSDTPIRVVWVDGNVLVVERI